MQCPKCMRELAPGERACVCSEDGAFKAQPSLTEAVVDSSRAARPLRIFLSYGHEPPDHVKVAEHHQLRLRPDLVAKLDEKFDIIVLDLTDPETPAEKLYTGEFFDAIKRVLAPGGAITLHIGSPIFRPETVVRLVGLLRERFRHVRPMGNYVPLYGSYWGFAMASDALDPLALEATEVDNRIEANGLESLSFYNGDTHRALFALPNYFRRLLA